MSQEDFLTILAAADYLKVSRDKIHRLVRDGKLTTIDNPLDNRSKLIAKSQLDSLAPGRIVGTTPKESRREIDSPAAA
jgi:hypothetical protein